MAQGNGSAFLRALSSEHAKGRECVAALRCFLAFDILGIRRSALFNVMGSAASERIVMTLARVLDSDSTAVTASSICSFFEQNPAECVWAFNEAGRARYADPKTHVQATARKWRIHWETHPLRERIKKSRDKTIAHFDKKQWLSAEVLEDINIPEVESLLDELMLMVNEFEGLMHNGQIQDAVFTVTVHEAAMTMAGYEFWLKGMHDRSISRDIFERRVEEIKKVIERQE